MADPLDTAALSAAFRRARKPSGDHLSETQWERLTCDEMAADERDIALAHIMSCAECSTIHRSLIELRAGATEIEGTRPRPNAGVSYRRWTIPGGLATAAAIVLAIWIYRSPQVPPTGVTRSAREPGAVSAIAPLANQPLIDRRFSWQPVAGADSYELRVSTADGVRVFTSKRDETSAVLPAEIHLSAGSYYWQVVAFSGETTIATSPMMRFAVSR